MFSGYSGAIIFAQLFTCATIVQRYKKHKWTTEDEFIEKMYGLDFQRGESPVTFWWQGFNVGLEICADRGLLYAQGCTNLDLHILVSCGIRRAETGPLKKGGYALVDDGYSRKSSYVKK